MKQHVIGLDFGTDSVRAVIVDAANGHEVSTAVSYYPRWKEGKYCDPAKNQYRQHPQDYLDSLTEVIVGALHKAPAGTAKNVVGMSFDTTGSTPVVTDKNGIPLAMKAGFEDNPNAMFVLWKDHTAVNEAAEINALASKWHTDYTKYEGGIYSSEWVWAKMLHVLRNDQKVASEACSWVEHCDWIPAQLSGNSNPKTIIRSRCAAGHKAMWHEDWGGLPPSDFLLELDPVLKCFIGNLFSKTYPADHQAGTLSHEWARKLGLSELVVLGAGAFDCHMGAVGGGITPYSLVRVMGTSTCDILVAPYQDMKDKLIRGICGQVDGSVVPGLVGLEAGQSAFGDVYAWFRNLLAWPLHNIPSESFNQHFEEEILPALTRAAENIPDHQVPLATDWFNGRRTPDADQTVTASMQGMHLGTTAPMIYKSLVEATAFGSKAIADRFNEEGIKIKDIIAIGGVAKKSPFVMQILSNVMNAPIKVAETDQSCAHGAAMFAATVAGVYSNVEDAMAAMGQGFSAEYQPHPNRVSYYEGKYREYLKLAYH